MITTDEYKELINAQQEGEVFMMQLAEATTELRTYKANLEGLLNCITNGENPKWDEQYRSYELADTLVVTDYINKNFLKDGILTVRSNDND
jgi:hypothetical protein